LQTPLPTKKSLWVISPSSLMNSTQVSTYCGSDGFVEDIWKSTRRHPLSDVPGRPSVFLCNFFCFFCNSFCFLSWNDNEYKTFELYFVSGLIIKVKECHQWMILSLHSDILSWFRANQFLLFLLNAVCLTEKQQIPIL